jgi:pimeloyl-ACP methyl ester carboxylesterase
MTSGAGNDRSGSSSMPEGQDCNNRASGVNEGGVEVKWVEAVQSKGLALVCSSPDKNVAVIVVRGTVNLRNILLAFKLWPGYSAEPELGVRLHAGFAQVADELYLEIEPLLDKDMSIHLTGHSMGGAVCIILGMRLLARGYRVAQVVAFGSPMVVWNGASELENFRCRWAGKLPLTRVEHCLDPVVNFPVPTSALAALSSRRKLAMYAPVGTLVRIGSENIPFREARLDTRALHKRTSILQMSKAHRLWSYRDQLSLDMCTR